jgi:beta-xylosidase
VNPLVVVEVTPAGVAACIVGAAAFLGATAYLFRQLRKLVRYAQALHTLTERELTNNHGSSLKDDVDGIAVSVGQLGRRLDDFETRFNEHVRDQGLPWTP